MKPTPSSSTRTPYGCELLAFGAHPDDIEFGCGGVIAGATLAGARARVVVCSRGEAGTRGTPRQRMKEAIAGAARLGASAQFVLLDGDSRLEHKPKHARALAAVIRAWRPRIVLATTPVETQHPDHARLGRIVRDAARLARYSGIAELKRAPAHAIEHLLFYAVTPEGEPTGVQPVLVDVSAPRVHQAWKAAMAAHATQSRVKPYAALQVARAQAWGLRAGRKLAIALYPDTPLVFPDTLALPGSARHF